MPFSAFKTQEKKMSAIFPSVFIYLGKKMVPQINLKGPVKVVVLR